MTTPVPRHFTRLLGGLLATAALAGCTVVQPDFAPDRQSTTVSRSAADAWARMPAEAGEILSVVEEIRPDARSQRIVLAGTGALPGENAVTVRAGGGRSARPTETSIAAEMEEVLPGIPMRPADVLGRNAYGPFAYALGQAGPFTCLYAWQHLEGDGRPGLLGARSSTVDVRVRLCREAEAADLAGYIEAMTVSVAARPFPAADPLLTPGADALAIATGGGIRAY